MLSQQMTQQVGIRRRLSDCIAEQKSEIAVEIWHRLELLTDGRGLDDPIYSDGVRGTIDSGLDYAIASVERGNSEYAALPPLLEMQARASARYDVDLDTIWRRYFVGYSTLMDFLVLSIEKTGVLGEGPVRAILSEQANAFERVLEVVSREYKRVARSERQTPESRREDCVRRLLAGGQPAPDEVNYRFGGTHVGAVMLGPDAKDGAAEISSQLDCAFLAVPAGDEMAWAWFGASRSLLVDEVVGMAEELEHRMGIGVGEPDDGVTGWRLTHEQARLAAPIALRIGRVTRYSEVALLASFQRDPVLLRSADAFFASLFEPDDRMERKMRATLRAYLEADRNVSSAAALLGVSRRTVGARLKTIEERSGRPLSAVLPLLEAAIRIEGLGQQ